MINYFEHFKLNWQALLGIIAILGGSSAANCQTGAAEPQGIIERIDSKLDAIIKKDAKVEVIANGFTWVEGPVWIESQQMLLVSDVFKNQIYKWTPKKGKELYLEPSGYTQAKPRPGELGSNGLALNSKRQLLLCQHGDRRIAFLHASISNPQPSFKTLANAFNTWLGKSLTVPTT